MVSQCVLNGLVAGSIYGLVALGYSLIYGVARLINLALGDMATVGAYAFLAVVMLAHGPFALGLAAALVAPCIISLMAERIAFRPAARSGLRLAPVISTLGVAVVLQAVVALIFGSGSTTVEAGFADRAVSIGQITTTVGQMIAPVGLGIAYACLLVFTRYTRTGLALRAASDDPELARAVGINPNRAVQVAFAISGVCAGLAGLSLGLDSALRPGMGYSLGFAGFSAAVLGGIGRPGGAIMGAVVIGLLENLAAGYLSSQWKAAYAFLALLLVLLVRPRGILTGQSLGVEE